METSRFALVTQMNPGEESGTIVDVAFKSDETFANFLAENLRELFTISPYYDDSTGVGYTYVDSEKDAKREQRYYCGGVEELFDEDYVDITTVDSWEGKVTTLLLYLNGKADIRKVVSENEVAKKVKETFKRIREGELQRKRITVGMMCYATFKGKTPVPFKEGDHHEDFVPADLVDVEAAKTAVEVYPAPLSVTSATPFRYRKGSWNRINDGTKANQPKWWGRKKDNPENEMWARTKAEVYLGFAVKAAHEKFWETPK